MNNEHSFGDQFLRHRPSGAKGAARHGAGVASGAPAAPEVLLDVTDTALNTFRMRSNQLETMKKNVSAVFQDSVPGCAEIVSFV
eukprot:7958624-Lingulodinium_polyedra.AAC.1